MIIFYFGADAYRILQARREITDRYQAKYPSGLNLFHLDGESAGTIAELEEILRNNSFFQEVKLIHITHAFGKRGIGEDLLSLLNTYDIVSSKDIVLCICETGEASVLSKTNKVLFAYLEKKAQPIKEFPLLNMAQQITWLRKEAENRSMPLSPDMARSIIERAGDDSWSLIHALEKLANYRHQGNIQPSDVELLIPPIIDQNIFALVDAIASKNKKLALELLIQGLASGLDPYYILSMVTFQFRNLLSVKDLVARNTPGSELARKSGLAPFVAKKTESQAKKFTLDELSYIFSQLAELDQSAKQGLSYVEDSLLRLVLSQK